MKETMYCFQCQEDVKGIGCTTKKVNDKNIPSLMNLLLFIVQGISTAANELHIHDIKIDKPTNNFIVDSLFITITNVCFDNNKIH